MNKKQLEDRIAALEKYAVAMNAYLVKLNQRIKQLEGQTAQDIDDGTGEPPPPPPPPSGGGPGFP